MGTQFRTVGIFSNETDELMTISLEVTCEEIRMSPGDEIELLAEDNDEHFPMNILYHKDGLQIYPRFGSTEWKFRYNGKVYEADWPSILSDLK